MNLIRRNSALTLAVLLTLMLAAAKFRSETRAKLAALPPVLVAPFSPSIGALKVQTRGAMITVAKLDLRPAKPAKVRGLLLRDKGEALGGGTPDRVDKSTGTLAAQ